MNIHYPPGIKPKAKIAEAKKKKKESPLKGRHILSAANRGQSFEDDINETNEIYRAKDLAIIYKRPTPINIVKVDYSKGAMITKAYFETQSTTDYNGIYKGKYIDFEAKSTHSKTALPLNNIAKQQIEHLESVLRHGGIAFFLIEFALFSEFYLLPADVVCKFYRERPRKSIPFKDIREKGYPIKEGFRPRIDYLPVVDAVFLK